MARLGDICEISAGQGAPQGADKYCNYIEGIPFIKAGDLCDLISGKPEREIQCVNDYVAKQHKLKLYPAGSILFAKSGMSCMKGHVYCTQTPCYVVSHLAIVIPKGIDGEFLKWYFQFYKPNSLIKDSAYPSISLQDISNMELNLPSLEEQRSIANNLNNVSNLISLQKQQLTKLDQLVKSRFIEMFGAYDLSHTNEEWKPISEIGKVVGGATPKTNIEEYWDGEYRWITPAELSADSGYIYDSVRKLTKAGVDSCSLQEMPIDTVILSSRAPIGKVAIAGNTFYCNQGFKNIICSKDILPRYLYTVLLLNTEYLNSLGRGATFKEISKSIVENIKIPVPPIDLQNQFAAFVEQTDKLKLEVKKSLEKLETLKKALMQKYFG